MVSRILAGLTVTALALALPMLPACTCKGPSPNPEGVTSSQPPASAAPSAAATTAESAATERSGPEAEVRPVYPPLTGPVDPRVERLCDALHTLPAKRRGECCSFKPQDVLKGECIRNLSGALKSNAISLADADIAACEQAFKETLTGCDWVSPTQILGPTPPACERVLKGTLASGASCRSSLECGEKLFCFGAGPTSAGRCGPPKSDGFCTQPVDPLATYVRSDLFEQDHPQCTGYCGQRRCRPFVAMGGACKLASECGPSAHCAAGHCAAGPSGQVGMECLGNGCASGLRCAHGTCQAPLKEGAACDFDDQCRGTCVKPPGADKGTCSAQCDGLAKPYKPTPVRSETRH